MFHRGILDGVVKEASEVMGIRPSITKGKSNLPMLGSNILMIEISGPEQPHLTVIDVPGLFQATKEGEYWRIDLCSEDNGF
ncbi:hypothetical protein VTI74DRAFT_4253 [Chaetomium olivicolor]